MAKESSIKKDLDNFRKLGEALKTRPSIQVGVFGARAARRDGGLTNADLAMYHELGSPQNNLPPRSMLREPIADHAKQIMASVKGMAEEFVLREGPLKLWKLIGIAAEKVVLQAFDTGGFGKWAPLKYGTLLAKLRGSLKKRKSVIGQIYAGQVGMGILIDRGELRRSFSSRVRMKI